MSHLHYRHTDGGLYRFVAHARSADTTGDVVVYEHLWPFEQGLWVRDRQEFESRFTPISATEVTTAMQGDRAAAQAAVDEAKAKRRAAKAG
ncbi:DUF1653 domain-containing protein [Chitinimonas viridis]|uniref:DUF1653 domain-containing protein n=2 Tax=Chitinimonas TaxID=240411 RepID=A0ABT8B662_9NEIS|nr:MULTISPECIES: DUF1653 domain-containing protein [Chitinimonas]MBL8508995.1 DUF1653 domain-containing protein [Chitinimonas sp.]MDN3577004.1 DUF1653 domain-containing protein [Chitinimonas viridis]GLR13634.1 hypothetical protein GCM10007907_24240 [Chitinimonas prasina]